MIPSSVAAMEALTTTSIAQLEHLANEVVAMEGKADELRRTISIHRQRQQQRQMQQMPQQVQPQVLQPLQMAAPGFDALSLGGVAGLPGPAASTPATPAMSVDSAAVSVPAPMAVAVAPPSYSAVGGGAAPPPRYSIARDSGA